MVDALVRDLEQTATISVDHADLVVIATRAGENDPPAMNAGGIGERGMRGRREGRVSRGESGFDRQPDRRGEFSR